MLKVQKMTLSPRIFQNVTFNFETEGVFENGDACMSFKFNPSSCHLMNGEDRLLGIDELG
jgi:hypothetical protein